MGYPAKYLSPGEQIALEVHPHWKYLARPASAVAALTGGAFYALATTLARWAEVALAGVLVAALGWLVGRYLRWATTSLVVTSHRLILRRGVLSRSGQEILLDRLTDISCAQSLWDRALGCGDVLLESPGRDSPEVFPDLPHPVAVQNEIYRLINLRRGGPSVAGAGGYAGGTGSGGAPAATGAAGPEGTWAYGAPSEAGESAARPTGPSVAEQLSQLDDLRRRGVISRREFAAKKAELLSRM